ncbi:MAG: hypothetical protein HY350_00845 [Candidatus Omnitrophica bacterium]|nr:hypothetical protein [Candidatus Omnitrophota bacterium]
MQDKIKLIIIVGLLAMLAASIFIGLQTYASRRALELERNSLRDENEALVKKIEEVIKAKKELQDKANVLNNDLDKASKEKQDIQQRYELIAKERDGFSEKIKALEKNNELLRGDLSNLQREKQRLGQRLEDNLAPIRNENDQLKQQLDKLNTLKSNLEADLGKIKGEKSDLERKLNQVDTVLQQALTKYKYLSVKEQLDAISGAGTPQAEAAEPMQPEKDSVELSPIVVKPQAQSKPEIPLRLKKTVPAKPMGTVLEINKETQFVIVDLGVETGIKLDDVFKVYRQGNQIATIEVIQVRQSISACDIKEEMTPIEAGDIVR